MSERSARKRKEIMEAATAAFLQQGYKGTTMDEIAAEAAVSKQTVYKHFSNKETLFADIVAETSSGVDESLKAAVLAVESTDDLRQLARQLVRSILDEQVLKLRRLIIAEAGRFPEIGQAYWEQGFDRGLRTIAAALDKLVAKGALQIADSQLAAHQLAGLCLWVPVNRIMFCGPDGRFDESTLERYADDAVRVFLAAYSV